MAVSALQQNMTVRRRLADLVLLTKPRLNLLVLMAAAAGFQLGSTGSTEWVLLLNTLFGILLTGSGSSVLNQVLEGQADGKMGRTKDRPLPAGRLGGHNSWLSLL